VGRLPVPVSVGSRSLVAAPGQIRLAWSPSASGPKLADHADIVFIDTAPHAENAALMAARAADIVLVPCRPSVVDLRAINASANIAQLAGKPAWVVLNQVPARGTLAAEAAEALETADIDLAPVTLGNRVGYIHAFTEGRGVVEYEPGSKAADEIRRLLKFIIKSAKEANNGQEKHAKRRTA